MGKKDLIAAARLNAPPRGGNIGRGMKVNKEEILGMYVASENLSTQIMRKNGRYGKTVFPSLKRLLKKSMG